MTSVTHVDRLEREVKLLRALLHASSASSAQRLVAEAEASSLKRLKRARKRLLLACHPDKCEKLSRKELSEHFTREVVAIMNF